MCTWVFFGSRNAPGTSTAYLNEYHVTIWPYVCMLHPCTRPRTHWQNMMGKLTPRASGPKPSVRRAVDTSDGRCDRKSRRCGPDDSRTVIFDAILGLASSHMTLRIRPANGFPPIDQSGHQTLYVPPSRGSISKREAVNGLDSPGLINGGERAHARVELVLRVVDLGVFCRLTTNRTYSVIDDDPHPYPRRGDPKGANELLAPAVCSQR